MLCACYGKPFFFYTIGSSVSYCIKTHPGDAHCAHKTDGRQSDRASARESGKGRLFVIIKSKEKNMNLIGKKVTHKKFGLGTIREVQTNKVRVDFKYGIKTFAYPESFEKFFEVPDQNTKAYIQVRIEESNRLKALEQEEKSREELRRDYARKLKIKENSHAVFGMRVNNLNDVLENWSVSTGTYLSGANKGKPRIPKVLNMNSACLLTVKAEGQKEADRTIAGIFMASEDFIGLECQNGIICAHEKHRIIWEAEDEDIRFWDYFSGETGLSNWGNCEIKYISNKTIKKILEDMMRLAFHAEKKKEICEFYNYFLEMNHM